MPRWYDKACDDLDEAAANGEISDEEYQKERRELNWALRDEAEEAAERAREDVYGGW